MANPILVNTVRGDMVESRHRGSIAVCDPSGKVVKSWGDIDALVYPRSAIKAIQALPLVESGAAEHFNLDDAELALACSSHGGEPGHTETVSQWLKRIKLDNNALECGAHIPTHAPTAADLVINKKSAARVHNNCSGKHTGMLTTAQFMGEQTKGYMDREHPVQQRWFDTMGEMAGVDMRKLPWNRDGCGIPVIAMPLVATATAFARFAAPDNLPEKRAYAIDKIANAIAANPFMVAGTNRLCTEVMNITGKRVMIKTGAEGVYAAAIADKQLGIVVKIDDGLGAASEVAILGVLAQLKILTTDELEALAKRCKIPIINTVGFVTGYREVAEALR